MAIAIALFNNQCLTILLKKLVLTNLLGDIVPLFAAAVITTLMTVAAEICDLAKSLKRM